MDDAQDDAEDAVDAAADAVCDAIATHGCRLHPECCGAVYATRHRSRHTFTQLTDLGGVCS